MKPTERRSVLKKLLMLGAASTLATDTLVAKRFQVSNTPDHKSQQKRSIYIFSKHLQWLQYSEMAQTASDMGFDGVDITVRPGGHVLPENVESDLPKAVKAVKQAGLDDLIMTTSILEANETTERILRTASELGIKNYRMGWHDFDHSISIVKNIKKLQYTFQKLNELNEKYSITAGYQNHAGDGVGSSIWDSWMILNELNTEYLGCQYDIRHSTVEGFNSWVNGLRLVVPMIKTIVIKDFIYAKQNNKWVVENVPLGNGVIDFKGYFQLLNELGVYTPISLHVEHDLGGAEKGKKELRIPKEEVIKRIKNDLEYLKKVA